MVSYNKELELKLKYDNIFCERNEIIISTNIYSKIEFLMHNNLINIDNSVNILREYINLPNLSIKKLLTYYNQLLHYIHNKNKLLKNNTYFIHFKPLN